MHYRRMLKHGDITHDRAFRSPKARACAQCSKTFVPNRHNKEARFCSRTCYNQSSEAQLRMATLAKENRARIGDALRGRGTGDRYRRCMGRAHHRVVAEEMLGRPLRDDEIVHHKDGNRGNNRPENLEVMSRGDHVRLHQPRIKRSVA
jgi:hypothetical protein